MEIEKLMRHHSATKKRIKFGSTMFFLNYFCRLSCLRASPISLHRNWTVRFIIVFSLSIFPVNVLRCQPDGWALLPLYPRIKLK